MANATWASVELLLQSARDRRSAKSGLSYNRIDLFKTARTGESGEFRFESVPPGDYKLFAWEDIRRWCLARSGRHQTLRKPGNRGRGRTGTGPDRDCWSDPIGCAEGIEVSASPAPKRGITTHAVPPPVAS